MVGSSNAVGRKKRNNLIRRETSIAETLQNTVDSVERLWNEQIGCGLSSLRTTEEELETRSTRAVGNTDGTGELDAGK